MMTQTVTRSGIRGRLRRDVPLATYCTWRAGGPADWLFEPADRADLAAFLRLLPAAEPLLWLGLGSNLLVRDGGFRGTVICLAGALGGLEFPDALRLRAEAGVTCAKIARVSVRRGCGGAEFMAGIPGTLGGALAMNAGAWGGETWPLVESVETIDRAGTVRVRAAAQYTAGYRTVRGPEGEWFVGATLALRSDPDGQGAARIRALLAQRQATQPLGVPSCGSVFRNPPGDHAARLIEACGLKGLRSGGCQVSPRHANFIVNDAGATATDIERLLLSVRDTVARVHGIELVPEVRIVGEAAA